MGHLSVVGVNSGKINMTSLIEQAFVFFYTLSNIKANTIGIATGRNRVFWVGDIVFLWMSCYFFGHYRCGLRFKAIGCRLREKAGKVEVGGKQ